MKAKSTTLRGEARTNGPIEQKGNIMLTWTTPVYQLAATATNRFHDLTEHEFMLMCGTASGHAIAFGPSLAGSGAAPLPAQPPVEIRAVAVKKSLKHVGIVLREPPYIGWAFRYHKGR
jgi:hypothetical protein